VRTGKASFEILPQESRIRIVLKADEDGRQVIAGGEASELRGQFTVDYDHPSASRFDLFVVDLGKLTADSSGLGVGIWEQWLETAQQLLATFQVTETRGVPSHLKMGQPIHIQLVGEMRVKGVVKTITWDATVTFEAHRASGTATTSILMADLDLPPSGTTGIFFAARSAVVTLDFVLVEVEPLLDPPES
jgi:hypothetical protein